MSSASLRNQHHKRVSIACMGQGTLPLVFAFGGTSLNEWRNLADPSQVSTTHDLRAEVGVMVERHLWLGLGPGDLVPAREEGQPATGRSRQGESAGLSNVVYCAAIDMGNGEFAIYVGQAASFVKRWVSSGGASHIPAVRKILRADKKDKAVDDVANLALVDVAIAHASSHHRPTFVTILEADLDSKAELDRQETYWMCWFESIRGVAAAVARPTDHGASPQRPDRNLNLKSASQEARKEFQVALAGRRAECWQDTFREFAGVWYRS